MRFTNKGLFMRRYFLLILLFLFSLSHAKDITIIPYGGYTTYSDANKSSSFLGGLYAKFEHDSESYEVAFERKVISFNDYYNTTANTTQSYNDEKQNDLSLLYSYIEESIKYKIALHYIGSSSPKSNESQAYLAGVSYRAPKGFEVGLNLCYSLYAKEALSKHSLQLTPNAAIALAPASSPVGSLYARLFFYYANHFKSSTLIDNSYSSFEVELNQQKGRFTNRFAVWYGKQLYVIKDDIFTFYNQAEVHNGGYLLSSRYAPSDSSGIKLSWIYEDLNEVGRNATHSQTILLSYDLHF